MRIKNPIPQVLRALNQVVNTVVWLPCDGFGYADEMLSARAWRLRKYSNVYKYINKVFFWHENHCKLAYRIEMDRKQLPEEYRLKEKRDECRD